MCFLLKQKVVFRQSVRERERQRQTERQRQRFTDLYRYSHDSKHANKAMVSPEKMSFLFFFMTSNSKIRRDERQGEKDEKIELKSVVNH